MFVLFAALLALGAQNLTGSLQGLVLKRGTTEPIAQVELELRAIDNAGAIPLVSATMDNGRFRFSNVAPGKYRIIAVRAGFAQAEYSPIVISPGLQQSDLQLALTPGAAIAGKITARGGQPVQRAEVQAVKVSYPEGRLKVTVIQSTITNDLGEYRLFWLPPGQYYVCVIPINLQTVGASLTFNSTGSSVQGTYAVSARPAALVSRPAELDENEAYVPTYFPGVPDPTSGTMLNLGPSEEIRDVNVSVSGYRSARLRGTVTDPLTGGPAPADTRIDVTPLYGTSDSRSVRMVNNAFTLDRLTPGFYELRASVPKTDRIGRAVIELRDRDLDVSLELSSFSIRGKVHGETLPPNKGGLQVLLGLAPAFQIAADVAADGTFRLARVPAGDYGVYVSRETLKDAYVKAVRFGPADVLNGELHVDGQTENVLDILLATDGGSMRGRVVNEKQETIANATVVVIPDGASPIRFDRTKTAVTNETGEFDIQMLPPGDYFIYSWENVEQDAWFDPNFLGLFRSAGRKIHINPKQSWALELRVIR